MMDTTDETVSSAVYSPCAFAASWPDRPAVWFAKAEAQFVLGSMARQLINLNYVVPQLKQQQAADDEDIITSPPEQEPYVRL